MESAPKTLQEAIIFFSDHENCHSFMVARRWPDGSVTCPRCGADGAKYQAKYKRWQCGSHHPKRQFTLKTGTIFEDSPLSLSKWLPAVWLIVNCKNGVSSYEIHRALGVTQKTAWFMLHRIRLAMRSRPFAESMSGEIEADETFIGGKARNMHKGKRAQRIQGRGPEGKTVVAAVLARHGEVRSFVAPSRTKRDLQGFIRENVAPGASIYTDELLSYDGLDAEYVHQVINHAEAYVSGVVHTNGMENYWSLLKRGINGTYVSVEPFHLHRYLDEQAFRFNNRKGDDGKDLGDAERFSKAVSQAVGNRVTYGELTGKVGETAD